MSKDEAAPRRRGRPRSEHARQAVLAATIAMLAEVGYRQMSLDGVATRAGVGKATLYRWWPNKARLVISALGDRASTPGLISTGDSRTDIADLVRRTIAGVGEPALDATLPALILDLEDDPDGLAQLRTIVGPHRAAHAAGLLAAAGRGDLPHDIDTNLVLDLIAGVVMYRRLNGHHQLTDQRLVDQLTDLVLTGALPRTSTL